MRRFLRAEDGLESVEYAVILTLITASAVAAWLALGESIIAQADRLAELIGPIG